MLPMFKRANILPYLNTIITGVDQFINEKFVAQDGQIHTDLVIQCQNLFLNVFTHIAFNYDLQSLSETDAVNLGKAFTDFVLYANQFILLTGIPFWLGKILLSIHWKYQRALRTIKHYVMNIIVEEQKRQQDEYDASTRPKNLISSLVSSVKK